jgi:flagellar basal body-associated protein FliL
MHDFSKPPHVTSPEETAKKRRLPVYILIIVGLFLIALIVYMVADHSKTPKEEVAFQHEATPHVIKSTSDLNIYKG